MMKFTVTHAPDGMGHHIAVAIDGAGAAIASVRCTLDGVDLVEQALDDPSAQYSVEFRHVGSLTPADDHTLVVTARDSDGAASNDTMVWTD